MRMALGETDIVRETRDFLEEHGVHLDAFGKVQPRRLLEITSDENCRWFLRGLDEGRILGILLDRVNLVLHMNYLI